MKSTLRQKLGALLFDVPGYLYLFAQCNLGDQLAWLRAKDRDQSIDVLHDEPGVKCNWKWTSNLYLPQVFPFFAKVLFDRALYSYPIEIAKRNLPQTPSKPQLSFVIGHRGTDRIKLLLKTIDTISNQTNCTIECVVVEQDIHPIAKELLPKWVKYVFTKTSSKDAPYSRAWTFNEGVKHASADCIILHDNDLLVSHNYASETLKKIKAGYDFINLKRFIFYLDRDSSDRLIGSVNIRGRMNIESIMQNAEGGGSIGMSRRAYQSVGGFDERFTGWGGEDNEFWERAKIKKVWQHGYLPLIHLWHAPQAEKLNGAQTDTLTLYRRLSLIPPEKRIETLLRANENAR